MFVAGGGAMADLAYQFGHELGIVFQIVDDVLDLVGDEAQTGKARGIDLVEGVYTLPTLLALRHDDDDSLRKLLRPDPSADEVQEAIDLIVNNGGVRAAVDVAAERLARCDQLLEEFPESEASSALGRLSRYVLERTMLEF